MKSLLPTVSRWLLFLPAMFTALGILEAFGAVAVFWVQQTRIQNVTVLQLIFIIFLASIALTLVYGFLMLVVGCTAFCARIAPNPKVGIIVFLTLFALIEITFLIRVWRDASGFDITYHLLFAAAVFAGGILIHHESSN
jgi:hypothetical protein